MRKMYLFEADLVKDLESVLTATINPFVTQGIAFEFRHNDGGRADVIAVSASAELLAFEAKLANWRVALNQAYRNTSFCHYSYVVLPVRTVKRALRRRHEFDRAGVGLCGLDGKHLTIEVAAVKRNPFQPWLTASALEYIGSDKCQRSPHSYQSPSHSVLVTV